MRVYRCGWKATINRPGADEDRTQTGDHAIRGTEIGRPFSRTIEDQPLVVDEDGRTAGSYQDRDTRKECSRVLEFAMHRLRY